MKRFLIPLISALALPNCVFAGETISNPPDSFVKIYEKHTEEKYPTSNGKIQSGIAFYIDKDSIKEFNNIVSDSKDQTSLTFSLKVKSVENLNNLIKTIGDKYPNTSFSIFDID